MAVPKRRKDRGIKNVDPFAGPQRWKDQFLEQNKSFLPREVLHEDLDIGFVDFIESGFDMSFNGDKTPVIFLTLQRWAEFAKTWQHSDKYKNIKIPFITVVRKPDAQPGTNPADFKIPVRRTFDYMKIPVWNGSRKGMDIYKVPQPVGVDMLYEVRLFTYKLRQLNKMHAKILQQFASGQSYVNIKGHYFPILLESISDESTIDNLEGKRYYVQTYEMKLQGYLVDEDEFEVVPAIERSFLFTELVSKKTKPKLIISTDNGDAQARVGDNEYECIVEFVVGSPTTITFGSGVVSDVEWVSIETDNIDSYTIRKNGQPITLPSLIGPSDFITISIVKEDSNKVGDITIRGLIRL